jgi:2-iminobutanoate/2-iminopropanoate deaminase
MIRHIETQKAPKPFSLYSQAVAVGADAQLIFVSGQVGVSIDGRLAEGEAGQHRQIWYNILGLLESEGLGPHDIVEITAYVTAQGGIPVFRQIRDEMLDGAKPASTLLIVAGLADPSWMAEISVTAAKIPNA